MPQPQLALSGNLVIAKFGNAPLPNGQGTMAYANLNDAVNCTLDAFSSDDDNRLVGLSQLLYQGEAAYTSDDWGPRTIHLPIVYQEDSTHFLGGFLATLEEAGEQQLTFDNATYILAKCRGMAGRALRRKFPPFPWNLTLEFIAKSGYFQDAAATTATPWNPITVDAGQTANITYAGSVWCKPVWTLDVPVGNTVAINSFQLRNTMSGEFLTINFLSVAALAAGVHTVITIDCAAKTVTDGAGNFYDTTGSFPMLYPPAGQVNTFNAIVTPASGSSSGLTVAYSVFPRWRI